MSKRVQPSSPAIQAWASVPNEFPDTTQDTSVRRPDTALEALMETAPYDTPETAWEDIEAVRELVAAVVDMLEPIERFVIESLFMERLSLRATARRMSRDKNAVARIRDNGLAAMKDLLTDNKHITERLNNGN